MFALSFRCKISTSVTWCLKMKPSTFSLFPHKTNVWKFFFKPSLNLNDLSRTTWTCPLSGQNAHRQDRWPLFWKVLAWTGKTTLNNLLRHFKLYSRQASCPALMLKKQGDQLFKIQRCLFRYHDALLLNKKTFEKPLIKWKKHLGIWMLLIFLSCCFWKKTASQDAGWSHCQKRKHTRPVTAGGCDRYRGQMGRWEGRRRGWAKKLSTSLVLQLMGRSRMCFFLQSTNLTGNL